MNKAMDREILFRIESYLESYDKVILIDTGFADKYMSGLCDSLVSAVTDKKYVLISNVEYPKKPGWHTYMTVPKRELETMMSLYRCYEASDKLVLLSEENNYGCIWNYVKNGIMSLDEAFAAVLM